MAYSSNRTGAQVDAALDKADASLSGASINTLAKLNALILDATLLTSSAFSAVALTGNYTDLSGRPGIPTALSELDTTVTGAELNADHTKLGLIEPGATADQSGAEITASLTATLGNSDWRKPVGTVTGTVAAGNDTRFLTTTQKTGLTGSLDTSLHYHAADRNRANHTGVQATSTISGLDSALAGKLSATHTVTYNHALLATALQPGDAFPASDVTVTASPVNYSPASADVEDHLAGIDTVLAGIGGPSGGGDILADGTVPFTGIVSYSFAPTFTAPNQLVSKSYVDNTVTAAGGYTDAAAVQAVALAMSDTASVTFSYNAGAGTISATAQPTGINHDALLGFVSNEHIDWTADQGAINIHTGNIPALSYEAAGATATHVGLPDPHTQYLLESSAALVATSGSYTDLSNKPTIPTVPTLAPVATSGSYTDLTDQPTIPTVPALATVATSGSYTDLINQPTIPTVPTLATVATSGSYTDLINQPTIPTVPTLATVATSGSYNDLADKPTIPAATSPYPAVATKTAAATTNFVLDTTSYACQLNTNITTLTVSLPPGGNATSFMYSASITFKAPGAGTGVVTIPSGWENYGEADPTISLTAGDKPILLIITTDNDSATAPTIRFVVRQGETMP